MCIILCTTPLPPRPMRPRSSSSDRLFTFSCPRRHTSHQRARTQLETNRRRRTGSRECRQTCEYPKKGDRGDTCNEGVQTMREMSRQRPARSGRATGQANRTGKPRHNYVNEASFRMGGRKEGRNKRRETESSTEDESKVFREARLSLPPPVPAASPPPLNDDRLLLVLPDANLCCSPLGDPALVCPFSSRASSSSSSSSSPSPRSSSPSSILALWFIQLKTVAEPSPPSRRPLPPPLPYSWRPGRVDRGMRDVSSNPSSFIRKKSPTQKAPLVVLCG